MCCSLSREIIRQLMGRGLSFKIPTKPRQSRETLPRISILPAAGFLEEVGFCGSIWAESCALSCCLKLSSMPTFSTSPVAPKSNIQAAKYRLVPTGALPPAAGFLRKKDHEAAYGQGAVLEQGALLECVVMPGSKGRLVKVTTDPQAVAHTVTKDQEGLNISERCALLLGPRRCRAVYTLNVCST